MNGFRIGLAALGTAFAYPRVLLCAWAVVTAIALVLVWPAYAALDAGLTRHPGAGFLLDLALDADFARRHPQTVVTLLGGSALMLLVWAWLAGGVIATVGVGRRFSFTELLGEGASFLLRSLRVLALGLGFALLLGLGLRALEHLLVEQVWRDADPGVIRIFGLEPAHWLTRGFLLEALHWLYGFLFLVLVFTSKLALARLVVDGRRSAVLAWGWAVGIAVLRPLRTGLVVGTLALVWLLGSWVLGALTAWALEQQQSLVLGLVLTQAQVFLAQAILVAFLVAARRLATAGRGPTRGSIEPIVVVPARAPGQPVPPSPPVIAVRP